MSSFHPISNEELQKIRGIDSSIISIINNEKLNHLLFPISKDNLKDAQESCLKEMKEKLAKSLTPFKPYVHKFENNSKVDYDESEESEINNHLYHIENTCNYIQEKKEKLTKAKYFITFKLKSVIEEYSKYYDENYDCLLKCMNNINIKLIDNNVYFSYCGKLYECFKLYDDIINDIKEKISKQLLSKFKPIIIHFTPRIPYVEDIFGEIQTLSEDDFEILEVLINRSNKFIVKFNGDKFIPLENIKEIKRGE